MDRNRLSRGLRARHARSAAGDRGRRRRSNRSRRHGPRAQPAAAIGGARQRAAAGRRRVNGAPHVRTFLPPARAAFRADAGS